MPLYTLEIVEGPEAGRQIPINGSLVVGRDPRAGVVLAQDDLISRRHVRLTPTEDGVIVEDLGSANGTFVDGEEIHGQERLSPGGQLLLGVTVHQLRTAEEIASRGTAVRPIPKALSGLRPLPAAEPTATAVREVPTFAVPDWTPDYVPDDLAREKPLGAGLYPLLDVHTKSKARAAPVALLVLAAIVVILYLALR